MRVYGIDIHHAAHFADSIIQQMVGIVETGYLYD